MCESINLFPNSYFTHVSKITIQEKRNISQIIILNLATPS